jgi:hypothetical protein
MYNTYLHPCSLSDKYSCMCTPSDAYLCPRQYVHNVPAACTIAPLCTGTLYNLCSTYTHECAVCLMRTPVPCMFCTTVRTVPTVVPTAQICLCGLPRSIVVIKFVCCCPLALFSFGLHEKSFSCSPCESLTLNTYLCCCYASSPFTVASFYNIDLNP